MQRKKHQHTADPRQLGETAAERKGPHNPPDFPAAFSAGTAGPASGRQTPLSDLHESETIHILYTPDISLSTDGGLPDLQIGIYRAVAKAPLEGSCHDESRD